MKKIFNEHYRAGSPTAEYLADCIALNCLPKTVQYYHYDSGGSPCITKCQIINITCDIQLNTARWEARVTFEEIK